jgi:predicted DCC family thiol-disulfide oxidoreductase YuxK
MADSPGQGALDLPGQHLVLFDGVCGLCNRLTQFLIARDPRGIFAFAALQSDIGRSWVTRFGHDPDVLSSFYVIARYRQPSAALFARSRAVLFVVRALGWPWKALGVAGLLPAPVLNAAYDAVARSRYRVFGRREHCMMPTPEQRGRFVG